MITWTDLAVIIVFLMFPLVVYVAIDGLRKQQRFESSRVLIESALVTAERTSIGRVDSKAALERIKELETENSRLRDELDK